MRFIIAVFTAWLIGASHIEAVTLQSGEYNLEWQVTALSKAAETFLATPSLGPLEAEQKERFEGFVSDEPLTAVARGVRLLLDESGGSQTGYDSAYLVPADSTDKINLANLTPIRLEDRGGVLSADETKPVPMDVKVGEGQCERKLKMGVLVQVSVRHDPERGRVPMGAGLLFIGHWKTEIPSDAGPVELQVVDKNGNGTFNDTVSLDPDSQKPKIGDMIALRNPNALAKDASTESGAVPENWYKTPLGKTLLYDGKLYSINLRFGDGGSDGRATIEIKPYTGETGILRFETRDGKGNLVQAGDSVRLVSTEVGGLEIISGQEVTVPVGEYRTIPGMSVIFGERKKRGDPGFIATVKTNRVAKIEAGKTCVFAVGGPVKVRIDPQTDVFKWSRGEEVIAKVWIYAGEDDLISLGLPEPPVLIEFRDAAGRLVARSRQTLKFDNPRGFSLRPPESLVPGPHYLIVSVTPGEYQPGDTITDHKPLIILPGD